MRRDNLCPFSGVTIYGRVWRKGVGKRGLEFGTGISTHSKHAFRHLPPNSARFSYATEGAFFISTDAVSGLRQVWVLIKLQTLVYDILPSTTAVFSYAIGPRKLTANEQFFVGAQTVVSLLQTTQIKKGVSFIAADKVYTCTSKSTIV